MLAGRDANYGFSEAGNPIITFRNNPPMKFRSVYTGTGILTFRWASTGKSSYWQCQEKIEIPKQAQFKESIDAGGAQLIAVELERDQFFPFSGIVKPNTLGAIAAPAVHFDIEFGQDMWAFLLRAPWFQFKLSSEREALTVSHGSSQATATLSTTTVNFDQQQQLQKGVVAPPALGIELASNGTDFHGVSIKMKRSLAGFKMDEIIGSVPINGTQNYSWRPIFKGFDVIFIFPSQISLTEFVKFLAWGGLQVSDSLFNKGPSYDSVLQDGPSISYTLDLVGERRLLPDVHDESKISLFV
jgi:hypothetical protein